MCVCIYKNRADTDCFGTGHVYERCELVKAGNVSLCYIGPLDWSIIILGTHPSLFSPSVSLRRLLRFLALPSLRGSFYLRVIVAVITHLALSSAPCSTNTHKDAHTSDTDVHIQANTPHPLSSPLLRAPLPRWTDWEQSTNARSRLHSPLLLPPTINPTSLILRLHYDCRRSPALLIISSSFTSPSAPLTPLFFCTSPSFLLC